MKTENETASLQQTLETPRYIAKALNTTPQTINSWHRRGIINARVCVGRVVRFDRAEVFADLEAYTRKHKASS